MVVLRLHQFSVECEAKGCQIYSVFTRKLLLLTTTPVKITQTSTQGSLQKKGARTGPENMSFEMKNNMENVTAD